MTKPSATTIAFIEYLQEKRTTRGLAIALCEVLARRHEPLLIPIKVSSCEQRVAS